MDKNREKLKQNKKREFKPIYKQDVGPAFRLSKRGFDVLERIGLKGVVDCNFDYLFKKFKKYFKNESKQNLNKKSQVYDIDKFSRDFCSKYLQDKIEDCDIFTKYCLLLIKNKAFDDGNNLNMYFGMSGAYFRDKVFEKLNLDLKN